MNAKRTPLCVALAVMISFGLLSQRAFGQESIDERFQRALQAELQPATAEPVQSPEPISAEILPVPDFDVPHVGPEIVYERPAQASAPEGLYFVRFSADWCQRCREMEATGIFKTIRDGFPLTEVDIDKNPDARVKQIPQLWLCDKDRQRLRIWTGAQTADDIFAPRTCDGVVRCVAHEVTGSGVVLSDQYVLTAAHHRKVDGFLIDLPIDSFENDQFVTVPAVLEKTDAQNDLCLLRYRLPPGVKVKSYKLADTLSPASMTGFPFGGKSKRIRVKLLETDWKNEFGKSLAKLDSADITETQFGMSGGPSLNDAGEIVGIQSKGRGREIFIVPLDSIRDFLQGVDLSSAPEAPALLTVESNGESIGDMLAAALSYHVLQSSDETRRADDDTEPLAEDVAFGSLINVDFDAPDSAIEIARRVLAAKSIDFPDAGLSFDWSGKSRRIDLQAGRIAISPGVGMTVSKFGFKKSCRLDALAYTDDLSSVTFEMSGMLDLTVHLK